VEESPSNQGYHWNTNAETYYQLSLAYAFSHDIDRARAAATRAAQLNPQFPGLQQWLGALGLAPG